MAAVARKRLNAAAAAACAHAPRRYDPFTAGRTSHLLIYLFVVAHEYSFVCLALAGLAVDLRRGPLKVLALAESRAASFSLSSELHPITPQQLYPLASSSVVTAAGTVAQAQHQASWRAQQQAQAQAQAQAQQQVRAAAGGGGLQPIPLGGASRLNASAHWQLAGMGANSRSSSRMGSVDFGGIFAAAQAGASMAGSILISGSSVSGGAARTRHPSAGYAASAAAAATRRPSSTASHDAFTQFAHAAVAHKAASPRASVSAVAGAAAADAGSPSAAPVAQSAEPYNGLSGLFVRDDDHSESLVNLYSVCSGTSVRARARRDEKRDHCFVPALCFGVLLALTPPFAPTPIARVVLSRSAAVRVRRVR